MPKVLREGVTAAVVQSRIDQGAKPENLAAAIALARPVLDGSVGLAVLPEAFAGGVNFIVLHQLAEPVPDGPTCQALAGLARDSGAYLVAGVLEDGGAGRVYDSAVVVDPAGEVAGHYRRRFRWVGERAYVSAGDRPVVVDTALGRIGLLVGYDLCFPEAAQEFLRREVDVIACPASIFDQLNFGAPRLAQARAMDHHCYVLYANAVGFHQFANLAYTGRSGIYVDPYFAQVQLGQGQRPGLGCLAQAGDGECVLTAELHLDELRAARVPGRLPFAGDAEAALHLQPAGG